MESVIELLYKGGTFFVDPRFFKEYHQEEVKEIENDIECDKKRLKKLLMNDEALSEEEAKEIIREIEHDYERSALEYGFDEFACGWKIGAALMLEILNE